MIISLETVLNLLVVQIMDHLIWVFNKTRGKWCVLND